MWVVVNKFQYWRLTLIQNERIYLMNLSHGRDLGDFKNWKRCFKRHWKQDKWTKTTLKKIPDKLTITSKTCLSKEPWPSYRDFTKEGLPLWMTSMFCLCWVFQITQKSFHNSQVVPWLSWMFPFFLHTSKHNFNSLPWTLTRPTGPRRRNKKWTLGGRQLHDALCLLTFVCMMFPCCCWIIKFGDKVLQNWMKLKSCKASNTT